MKKKQKPIESDFRMEDGNILFIHPGIRLNQRDVMKMLRGEKLATYSISVALDGYYLFNTEHGRIETGENFKRVMNVLLKKFTKSEGYSMSVCIDYDIKGVENGYLNDIDDIEAYLKDI